MQKKKIRILFVTPAYEAGWKYGSGVISSLSALCKALAGLGHEITVYTTNASGEKNPHDVSLDTALDQEGVTVFYFKSTFGSKSSFASRGLSKKIKKTIHNFDIVYIAALWQWIGISASKYAFKNNVPFILGIHGGFSQKLRKKSFLKKNLFKKLFLNRFLQKASGIHLTGNAEKKYAGNWLESLPLFFVSNSADYNKYKPIKNIRKSYRKKWEIPQKANVLICAARPSWEKRIDVLIEAVKKTENWYFIFAGDDKNIKAQEWKKHASKLGVAKKVIWPGYLSNEKLCEAFSAADLFGIVSENENFGIVVIEAMLCQLPILISKDVGIWEKIKNNDFVYTVEKESEKIADKLIEFEEKKEINKKKIREFAIKNFSTEKIAKDFIKEVRRILSI
ncbi:MAG: glycosyltransferase [Spirochaetia bacterium]|nr:glycosyltransferase [Spirochaetia bacterium]